MNKININGKNYNMSSPTSDEYKKLMIESFGDKYIDKKEVTLNLTLNSHSIDGYFIELNANITTPFRVEIFDDKENLEYKTELKSGMYSKLDRNYYTKWKTKLYLDDLVFEHEFDLENSRVFIVFESSSLGDTIAWMPYCEEFRKKHNCHVIVSSFINSMFEDQYPEIEFVTRDTVVLNIKALYRLGWFYTSEGVYDNNKHPFDFKKIPLQKTATDILGLDYEEVRPLLKLPDTPKKKKVGIGFHSTSQSKYWNNPDGWQAVVDYLNNLGYECMIYSKESDGYMNNHYPKGVTIFKGGNLQEVINDLSECEFFIGLGSGLSWLAWACKLPVVLISGFSEKWAETTLDTYRVINESVCHGCFNSDRFDAGDWNWCPLHKNTDRMFECTKEITADMVINQIQHLIK